MTLYEELVLYHYKRNVDTADAAMILELGVFSYEKAMASACARAIEVMKNFTPASYYANSQNG